MSQISEKDAKWAMSVLEGFMYTKDHKKYPHQICSKALDIWNKWKIRRKQIYNFDKKKKL